MVTLSRAGGNGFVSPLVSHVCAMLQSTELLHVTEEEYAIFLTPCGELYDHSLLDRSASEQLVFFRHAVSSSLLLSFSVCHVPVVGSFDFCTCHDCYMVVVVFVVRLFVLLPFLCLYVCIYMCVCKN